MSFEAINWALSQTVGKSSAKFVLVVMANMAGDESTCWPSCKHLADVTGQDIKTVEAGIKRLRDEGHITDTGARKGATGQVIVYRLNTPENGAVTRIETPPNLGALDIPNTPVFPGNTPVFPGNTPVFPVKDPQISRETPPKTGDGTIMESIKEPKEKTAQALGISQDLLDDYLVVRKAKRAGALTATAISCLRREAGKAGLTISEAVTACCELGWQGFNAGWYAERMAKKPAAGKSLETTYQRSQRLRYEEATGRTSTGPSNVIDITPTFLEIAR